MTQDYASEPAPPGKRWVYAPYIRHWRTKRIIYPKSGRYFRFLVNE